MVEIISIQDIDQTHGLPGKKPNGKSKPVIVKLIHYNSRDSIYKNKKSLKGQESVWQKILRPQEWKRHMKQEKNMHLILTNLGFLNIKQPIVGGRGTGGGGQKPPPPPPPPPPK